MKRSPAGFLVSIILHSLVIAALLWTRRPKPVETGEPPPSMPPILQLRQEGPPKKSGRAEPISRPRPKQDRTKPRVNPAKPTAAAPLPDTAAPEPDEDASSDGRPDAPIG